MKRAVVMGVCAAVLVGGSAGGQEDGFATKLALGLNLTDGNSQSMQVNGSVVSEGEKKGLGSVRLGADVGYGETTVENVDEKTVDNARVFANVRKTLSECSFAYVDSAVGRDDIAAIDYRAMVGVGGGVYLARSDKLKLSVEAGVSYIVEEVADATRDYPALRVAERIDSQIGASAKIWQSAEYLPRADDLASYLLSAELGAEAALNATMSLRVVLQDKYDSEPAAGLESNDVTLIGGIGITL